MSTVAEKVTSLIHDDLSRRREKKAARDGRLPEDAAKKLGVTTGAYRCPTCGIRHWTRAKALACCEDLIESERLGHGKWDRGE